MHARLNGKAALAAFLLVGASVVTTVAQAPAAQAAETGTSSCSSTASGGTSGGGGGSVSGSTVTMWQLLTVKSQGALCPAGSSSGGGNYTPPQCWWGPEFSPTELSDDIGQLDTNGESAIDTYTAFNEVYAKDGTGYDVPATYKSTDGPPWEVYNIKQSPAGEWWGLIWSDTITEQGIQDCTAIDNDHFPRDWYWVLPGDKAPAKDAPTLDAKELALYVQGKVMLPALKIQTNPDLDTATKATVGLPTWVWADAAGSTITDEICTRDLYRVCVNMTATAASFSLSTDDSGASVFADCKRNADGTVGTKYTGQSGNPPCGITFSQPGTFNVNMQTTWNVVIGFTNDDGSNGQLTGTGTSETQVPANVQEVQAINQ